MIYRKVAIRVLYASICIAVIAGVLTLLAPGANDLIGRLLGTAIMTAVAVTFLLVAIKALETPATRTFGTTLGVLACCIYTSMLCSIWLDLLQQPPFFRILVHKFGLTSMFMTIFGIPILIGAACTSQPRGKQAGIALMGIWILLLSCWLLHTWIAGAFLNYGIEYFTVPMMIFSSIVPFVFIARGKRTRLVGIVLAALGCIAMQVAAYTTGGFIEKFPSLFIASLVLGWASAELGLWNLVTFRNEKYAIVWLERISAILCSIALASLCVTIWFEFNQLPLDDILGRIGGSSGILASASVLAIIVTQLLRGTVFVKNDGTTLAASCPRCKRSLFIPQGKSTCECCNLKFKVQIESTGCRACGYDLSGSIDSNRCSECGEPIALASPIE